MKLTIYRIFSFLLLPMAILFSLAIVMFLPAALSNPAMLFPLFLIACIVIYSFTSLNFLIKGIDGKKQLGGSSKDWIKVNAFVSIVYALLAISQRLIFAFNPGIVEDFAKQAEANAAGVEMKISHAQLIQYINASSYFLLVYGIILFVHIVMSFQYIKKYNYIFRNEQ